MITALVITIVLTTMVIMIVMRTAIVMITSAAKLVRVIMVVMLTLRVVEIGRVIATTAKTMMTPTIALPDQL